MNLLFLTSPTDQYSFENLLLKRIFRLLCAKNKIGYLEISRITSSLFNSKRDDVVLFKSIEEICADEWDVCIIHSTEMFLQATKVFEKIPIVFIALTENGNNECHLVPNLYRVITIDSGINTCSWGVPKEYTTFFPIFPYDLPRRFSKVEREIDTEKPEILFFHPLGFSDSSVSRSIIQFFNYFSLSRLTIVSTEKECELLSCVTNSNIEFVDRERVKPAFLKEFDVIIAGHYDALLALIWGVKKVIIIGKRGLGGVVDNSNLEAFIKSNLQGRIGGGISEPISTELLLYSVQLSLGALTEKTDNEKMELILAPLLENLKESLKDFNKTLKADLKISELVKNEHFSCIYLKRCDCIKIQELSRDKSKRVLINNLTGQKLLLVNLKEVEIINTFYHKEISLEKVLIGNPSYDRNELLTFIWTLWNLKIIYFNI